MADGVGLVIFNPQAMSENLDALIETYTSPTPTDVHAVVDGNHFLDNDDREWLLKKTADRVFF